MKLPQEGVKPDLHVHSVFSDGVHDPAALCGLAEKARLTHIALCDHDTIEGLMPMKNAVDAVNRRREKEFGPGRLEFLPAVELSAGMDGRTHVLGYGAGLEARALHQALDEAATRRRERFQEMVERLKKLGITLPKEMLPQDKNRPVGRAHLARILVAMGVVRTIRQAFERFLGEGKPAYVPYRHLSAAEAVSLLRDAGTVPVLAHPMRMKLENEALFEMVRSLQGAGLLGLEVYHPSNSQRSIRALESFARRQELLVTGGSDFHGDPGVNAHLGKLPAGWSRCGDDVDQLIARMPEA